MAGLRGGIVSVLALLLVAFAGLAQAARSPKITDKVCARVCVFAVSLALCTCTAEANMHSNIVIAPDLAEIARTQLAQQYFCIWHAAACAFFLSLWCSPLCRSTGLLRHKHWRRGCGAHRDWAVRQDGAQDSRELCQARHPRGMIYRARGGIRKPERRALTPSSTCKGKLPPFAAPVLKFSQRVCSL